MEPERKILAKSEKSKSLTAHLIDTMAVGYALMNASIYSVSLNYLSGNTGISRESVASAVCYFIGMHDVGKAHPIFQRKISSRDIAGEFWSEFPYLDSQMAGFRHEKYSADILTRIWQERYSEKATESLTDIISLHHQGKMGKAVKINKEEVEKWEAVQDRIEQIISALENGCQLGEIIDKADNRTGVCMTLLGLAVFSDWLASSELFVGEEPDYDITGDEKYKVYYENQKIRCKEAVAKAAFAIPQRINANDFPSVIRFIPREKMRPLQTVTEKVFARADKPLLTIIEAPMGEGKTEAGLFSVAALMERFGKDGFYVGLPTAATANQMYTRVSKFLASHGISGARLLHSMAWLLDDETRDCSSKCQTDGVDRIADEWTKPLRRGLLEAFSVGTIDQLLMSALRVKYGVLRLLGGQNKVLLLDEVHAYDAYMTDIILRLLEWCKALEIPIVMLSATLSTETKKKMLEIYGCKYEGEKTYPAITTVTQDGRYYIDEIPETCNRRKVGISLLPFLNDTEKLADAVLSEIKDGGNACILVNTVKRAQDIYSILNVQKDEDTRILLYHARFAVGRRAEIEDELIRLYGPNSKARPVKSIVICTQVVEQSLDVDFDVMFTDIAPIDLLLQRSGRECRHFGTVRLPKFKDIMLYILVPDANSDYEAAEKVYPTILLKRTQKFLEGNPMLSYPESIRGAVEYVYGSEEMTEEEFGLWAENTFCNQSMAAQASVYELPEPDADDFFTYGTEFFDDGESSSFLSAKTRISEETTRIAVVDEVLFNEIFGADKVTVKTAKKALDFSVTYSTRLLKKHIEYIPTENMETGKGYLDNVLILKGQNGTVLMNNGYEIALDSNIGFVIRQGGKNGV